MPAALVLEDDALPQPAALAALPAALAALPDDWAVARLDERVRRWVCYAPGATDPESEACGGALEAVATAGRATVRRVAPALHENLWGSYAYVARASAMEHWLWRAYPVTVTSDRLTQLTPPGAHQYVIEPAAFHHDYERYDSLMYDRDASFRGNLVGRHLICGTDLELSNGAAVKFTATSSDDPREAARAFASQHGIVDAAVPELLRRVGECVNAYDATQA